MPNYKAIRCFNCDSVIVADTPHVKTHPSGKSHLRMLRCPACGAITLQVSTSESKPYAMSRAVRERGYAKKGEWRELAGQ